MGVLRRAMHALMYRSFYAFIYLISLLPMRFLYGMAGLLFFLAYYIVGYRRTVVIANVSHSFPDKSYGEMKAIVKKFYACLASYLVEIVRGISASVDEVDSKLEFENVAFINHHLAAGRNVIACLGHCGNWEMLNVLPAKVAAPVYAIYRPLRSPSMNRLMIKIRSCFGIKLIADTAVVRHIRSSNASPGVYLFLADQRPRIQEETYSFPFLNQKTFFFSGMEKLARTGKAAVVYLYITQLSKGRYKISCRPICTESEGTNVGEITQKYVDLLAENINEEPYGWLWSHRRWKR